VDRWLEALDEVTTIRQIHNGCKIGEASLMWQDNIAFNRLFIHKDNCLCPHLT
jgi:hypothetical protein